MLTRVVAILRPLATAAQPDADPHRRGRSTSELREVSNRQCKQPYLHLADTNLARLISWTETGPNAIGESTAEHTMPIPSTDRYLCAYVILSDDLDEKGIPKEPIASNFALVDLTDIAPRSTPPQSPKASR